MPTDAATLARRDGVELIHTGSWQAMTGTWKPTAADIAAAVEAQSCPAIRKPVIKLGHTDSRFGGDGEPALGWFENLRATNGGAALVGDQVALPWLSDVQAAAYPSRSIEGNYNHRCSEGHVHPFVVTAVALLGVTPPAVQTLRNLNDLRDMLVAASQVPDGAEQVQVTVMASDGKGEIDRDQLKRYWTVGEGLPKWRDKPHPWTALYRHLKRYMNDELAKRTASQWFKDVFGYWPGSRKGKNPVGPG